jgi:hypothetical protein
MALIVKDRVLESSTSTGTGSFTLTGAQTGYQSFSVIGNGNTTYYTIQGKNPDGTLTSEWEVGVGTWSTGNTLARNTVFANSLGTTAKVPFSAGDKDVFVTYPSAKALLGDTSAVSSTGTGSVVLSNAPTITGSPNIGVALGTYISIGTGTSDPLETASITAIGGNLSIEGEPTLQSAISYIPFTFNSSVTANSLTGAQAVFTDGSKNLVSKATIGTGSVVLSSYLPAGDIVGTTDTQTLSNKRVSPRASTTASSATPTINTDNTDIFGLTAQAVDITSFTTNLSGTPTNGQKLWIYIVGTAARAITWGASFESSTATLPTTTVTTNRLDVGFVWNVATSKWRCVAVA